MTYLEMLREIRDACLRQSECFTCPFRKEDGHYCEFGDAPANWDLVDNQVIVPRLFK